MTLKQNLIAEMQGRSWEEVRTRTRQEVAKRWDAARYYLGVPFNGSSRAARPQALGHFFFEPRDLPSLVILLQERVPGEVQETVQRAERICRHEFDLLGYEQLQFGAEIDWHLDIVHGKRAPFKPWFQIRYLDFEEVGDAKITWELNRHQHLTTLAKAYLFTKNQLFADEVFRQWHHWWQKNPYPIGINWASSLEVAFRSLSWLWMQHLVEGCPSTPKDFPHEVLRALGISGRHLERYLSTYFSPNTHLLGEAVALFFIGTLCPQLSAAKQWQQLGWKIILREAARQVQADGMYFEQSIYYHVYALDFFLHARVLAAANEIAAPLAFDQTLQRMLELLSGVSQSGPPPRLGDDDGGRVFDPQRNRAHHLLDPLATGAALFERPDFKARAGLTGETIWLLGREGAVKFDRLPTETQPQRSIGFQSSGTYVMAGREPDHHQAVIDAGRLGAGRGGHGHADALSLCLAVDNREWLVDPGTFAYVSSGMERDDFRGTAAHNTLQVDGVDQAEPSEAFAWRSQPEVRVETWIAAESFDLLVASHTGYARLQYPVVHRRRVFYLKSRFWLVIDAAEGEGVHCLDVSWHLAPASVAQTNTSNGVCFAAEDQSALALLTVEDHDWTREITNGWWSPAYGKKEPCPILHFRKKIKVPAEFATLLHPASKGCKEFGHLASMKTEKTAGSIQGYIYSTSFESHYFYFNGQESQWESGPWISDASFLYCCITSQGKLRHLALCGGSFVDRDRRRIFAARRKVECFEQLQKGTGELSLCSDENAIELLPQISLSNQEVAHTRDRARDPEQEAS